MSEDKIYWSDLVELSHSTQVAQFGWCRCEDDAPPYDDCPQEKSIKTEGEILDEILAIINTDGASYTDGEVLAVISEILKREGK